MLVYRLFIQSLIYLVLSLICLVIDSLIIKFIFDYFIVLGILKYMYFSAIFLALSLQTSSIGNYNCWTRDQCSVNIRKQCYSFLLLSCSLFFFVLGSIKYV